MKNYWIIGDIHGEIVLLEHLLKNIGRYKPEMIVFVGDYIDRGPHVKEVIDAIMNLETRVVCLMGNHELMMLNAMEDMGFGGSPIELWYYNGGEATLQSFGFTSFFNFKSRMESRYLEFFQNLGMAFRFEPVKGLKILVTHAGISPAIPVSDQLGMKNYGDLSAYLLERHIDPMDSFLWTREAFFKSNPDRWGDHLVVHGHTPVMKLKRLIASSGQNYFYFAENDLCIRKVKGGERIASIDIDSGSVLSGRLSGLGFFIESESSEGSVVRMRSITVSREDIFPRDMGLIKTEI